MTLPPPHPAGVPAPAARAAVFALGGTVLGMSAHHLLTDGPVPWAAGAVAAAVFFVAALAGARRPRCLTAVVAASVGGQAALHAWLGLAAGPHGAQPGMGMARG